MTSNKIDILFSIMAIQEVIFFVPIAKRLKDEVGLNIAFLTFHEGGDDILEREGITYFSLHKIKRSLKQSGKRETYDVSRIEKNLGAEISRLIFHERHVSNRHENDLISKVINYYSIFNDIIQTNNIKCVIQELGGFIAPLTLYYVSRENNINHIFIEPAMFRKRIVFTLNNLYADIPDYANKKNMAMSEELQQQLSEYMTRKTVVIPKKDRHFFQDMTFRRLFSSDNFRRLSRKLYHKYVLRREEEYNWILRYITMHIVKAFRRKVLSYYYSHPEIGRASCRERV